MCGIAGFYGFRDDDLIKKFSEQLLHRGPDGEGFYLNNNASFLSRRLAIIDRKGGNQPIFNEDKTYVAIYNGEIYNFMPLRKQLLDLGHKFSTQSDTEVIVHGYEEWGDGCFDKFNGMFALAIYDVKNRSLILTRDHFGIKPLYFSILGPGKIVFSSEIKPIIYSGLIPKKPNDRIIYRYLKYRVHDDQRETFFKGVYRLMPGEMLKIQNGKLQINKYTNLIEELLNSSRQARTLNKKDILLFKEKLIEAMRLRLISEVPVGTCLSGGIDSSVIVAVINKLQREGVKEAQSVGKIQNTFSAVFPGSSNDEGDYINKVIKFNNLKSYKVEPNFKDFFNDLEEFVKTQEEPIISTGPYAQYKVMQKAQKHVTVLLDGQGIDEMMAGYLPYIFIYLHQLLKQKKLLKFVKEFSNSIDIVGHVLIDQLLDIFGIKKIINPDQLLSKDFVSKFKEERLEATYDNLKKRLIEDIFSNSLPALLRYEDKNAMRFSVEGRVPFLDFNLLRFLFSLPDQAIINNGWNKNILRLAVGGLIPEVIRRRRNKIGFTTPEQQWFKFMKNKIYSTFLSESFACRKYFNQKEVLIAFQKFIEGKNDDTMLFWRLLNVEIWMRVFFDKPVHQVHQVIKFIKNDFALNDGKKLEISIDFSRHPELVSGSVFKNQMLKPIRQAQGKRVQHDKKITYLRYPIRTEVFKKGDDISSKIAKLLNGYMVKDSKGILRLPFDKLRVAQDNPQIKVDAGWFLVVSEKIVAIAQGRSYFIWDIKPGFWANLLSKFVKKTPYGIGLGSPWTMQLAIGELGLQRILIASLISMMTKPFGFRGLFYKIAGPEAAAIDGPTEYSLYPSNVSAKLGPKNPQKLAEDIHKEVNSKFEIRNSKQTQNSKLKTQNFLGVVIIDANDLGQKVLGNSTQLDDKLIEKIFSDNPMGQADEQTPLVLVIEKSN